MNPPPNGANEVFSQEPQFPAYTYCISVVEFAFLRLLQLMKKEKVFEMKLTNKEKKMLDGYEGPARQKAMELHDWDVLGHAIGRKLPPHSIPVLIGSFDRPNSIQLKSFFAALACAAGTEMCHIVGITPEAPTLSQALANREPDREIEIAATDIAESIQELSGHGRRKIDYISLGCPHYHIEEIRRIATFLDGKRIHPDTTVHLWTAGSIKYMADRCGYTDTIQKAGAMVLTGSCPSTRGYPSGVQTAAYDSAKQRMSAAQETDATLFYGSRQECLQSAISGFWEGR